ncbi:VanZ family protein [Burkholderiaceae bacterium FT117]|uniref:VanZ family protein n=1 Tax=Zeimonas sediminis TaxID=2944268 RepID=UPI002343080C|nr:VanZ family protein [Zeimonas sediminis]MCM5570968.1 VanZ family protein [Zeimonas sediminis]
MTRSAAPSGPAGTRSPLAAWLLAWVAATVYGTLHPWSGWRAPTVQPLAFLLEGWPRYWTWQDLGLNFAAYLPLGLLATLLLGRALPRGAAALAAIGGAAALSCGLESLQALLPGRVSSLADLLANASGAAAGAALALALDAGRSLAGTRRPMPLAAGSASGGLLLLWWLAVQWHPQAMAFASGELAPLLAVVSPAASEWLAGLAAPVEQGPLMEAIAVAATVVGVGLLARDALRPDSSWAVAAPMALAAAIKSAASATLLGGRHAAAWLNAGTQGGLLAGALVLALASWWPRRARLLAAALALAAATALYNLAPPNVYFASTMAAWNQGEWANLNGLLRALATVWPFAAIAWCVLRLRPRGPRPIIGRP